MLDEILDEPVSSSRNRRNPRGVKRKMSNFPLRRQTDKSLPPIDIKKAIKVLRARPEITAKNDVRVPGAISKSEGAPSLLMRNAMPRALTFPETALK